MIEMVNEILKLNLANVAEQLKSIEFIPCEWKNSEKITWQKPTEITSSLYQHLVWSQMPVPCSGSTIQNLLLIARN